LLDGLLEWHSEKLLAIDIKLPKNAQSMKSILQKSEDSGFLTYEIGKLM